jgi:hypothetical protein
MRCRTSNSTEKGLRIITLTALALALISIWTLPAMAQNFSVQFGAQEFDVSPGDRFGGTIPVSNNSGDAVTVRIFIGDWVRVPDEADYIAMEGPGDEPRSLLSWMTFSPDSMTLEPWERREITFEVNVPDDSTLEGSYWALIFVEGMPPIGESLPDITSEESQNAGIGIRTVFRYVIRVIATIQDTETLDATFTAFRFEPTEDGFMAIATFQNNGNAYVKPRVWLELRNPAGETVYTENHIDMTVLPESARDFEFELSSLPIESGDYLVLVIADYGAMDLIAARGRVHLMLTPPDEEDEEGEEVEGGATEDDNGGADIEDEGSDDTGEGGGGTRG